MVFVSYTEMQFGPQTISRSLTSDDCPEHGFFLLTLLLQMEIPFPCCQAVSAKGCILARAACRQLLVKEICKYNSVLSTLKLLKTIQVSKQKNFWGRENMWKTLNVYTCELNNI